MMQRQFGDIDEQHEDSLTLAICLFEVCINVGHWRGMIGQTDESRFPMSTLGHAQVYYVMISGSAGSYQRKNG